MSASAPPIRLGLAGLGKIARDQHLPVIAEDPGLRLVACANRHARDAPVPVHPTLEAMLEAHPDIEAVALCTPPQVRGAQAAAALRAGRHVLLEKPPGASLGEVAALERLARERGLALFAAWHARFAPGVAPARARLAGREVREVRIAWREDVRRWHPGQDWVWRPGGLGVFDPGINALSIATLILPHPLVVCEGRLETPSNRQAPIAAALRLETGGAPVHAEFDWRASGDPCWTLAVETDRGALALSHGGARLHDGGAEVAVAGGGDPHAEYRGVYRRFAALVREGACEVDATPLRHVADAFLVSRRVEVDAFEW